MQCFQCQQENSSDRTQCAGCGVALPITCSSCGTELPIAAKFCFECGKSVEQYTSTPAWLPSPKAYTPRHLADKILKSRSALTGERKHVTVLFCDLIKSSALAKALGHEAMHTLLNKFFELALNEIHRYEGTINQFLGDGFMALFGAPLACEDHSHRALLAALGLQQAIMKQGLCNEYAHGQQVSIRIGLNTGPVVVGKIGNDLRMDYTAIGDTTNLAARLEALAEPGTIYLSEHIFQTIGRQFECEPIRTHLPKTKGGPVIVYKLHRVLPSNEFDTQQRERYDSSPLTGRDSELEILIRCMKQVPGSTGRIVFILGEPGIGKSRLVTEARQSLSTEGLYWLEGRAFSHTQSISYGLFVYLIKYDVGITEFDSDAEILRKLEQRLTVLLPDEWTEILPFLATLLSVDLTDELKDRTKYLNSEDMGRQIFRTSRRYFERLAQDHPLVLFFEDIHWSDESSMNLLEHLLPLTKTLPLLICCASRPDSNRSSQKVQNLIHDHYSSCYTEITLGPLSKRESSNVVCNLLGNEVLPSHVEDAIVEKAGGNPFFLEEVVRSLIDTSILEPGPGAMSRLVSQPIDELEIPETIDAVIMARVDRLPDDIKHVLKLASVIGRSFLFRILGSLLRSDEKLEDSLATLRHRDFIREKKSIPELEYFFKHALVQEAIYDSILSNHRRELHRQVAQCIESLYVDRQEEFYSLLAYHYARAEEETQTLEYLVKAGDQAGQLAADAEALKHYLQAMETYSRLFGEGSDPVQCASLERKIGEALFRQGDHGNAQECFYRALIHLKSPYPASSQAVTRAMLKQILVQTVHRIRQPALEAHQSKTEHKAADERSLIYEALIWIDFFVDPRRAVLDSLLELNLSERHNLAIGIVQGAFTLGLALDALPLSRVAKFYHRSNVALSEKIKHPRARGHAYLGLGIHEHYCGEIKDALNDFAKAETAYREAGNLRGAAAARTRISRLQYLQGRFELAIESAEQTIRMGREGAGHQALVWGLTVKAGALRDVGEIEAAIALLREAIEVAGKIPDHQNIATCRANLSKCYLLQNDLSNAMTEIEESCRIMDDRKIRGLLVTDIYLTAAEIMLCATEGHDGQEKGAMLLKAQNACKAARGQSRIDRLATPGAYCSQGTFFWLAGNSRKAKKWWMGSIESAKELGMEHKLGLTYLEMGRRTGDEEMLKRAKEIFSKVGAERDHNYTLELLP